jgi:YopX protein.
MREIKFRAWDTKKERFDYYPLISNGSVYNVDAFDDLVEYSEGRMILQQYTGLNDKNGKEIYEGDVLRTDLSRPYVIVVFRNGAFMYQCHDDGRDYFDLMVPVEPDTDIDRYLEVIGNIYEDGEQHA